MGRIRAVLAAVALAVCIVPAALPAPAKDDARVVTTTVRRTLTLAAGTLAQPTTAALTVPCPKGYKLTGAEYRPQSDLGQAVVGIHASVWGPDRYYVVLQNTGMHSESVIVEIVCGKVVTTAKPARSVGLPEAKVVTKTVPLAPATSTPASAACPRGTR